ncbi:hypothetical protein [Thiohalocapsa marina]|uniref:hypothetical protein n=1 Tax=Thiohalocapsa marina TaxID=424902 RepID=UPI001478F9A3|nr:hypothetical protein [Thiohalocapsa marina]
MITSQRKAIQALKRLSPDWVVAGFFYDFGKNSAGANASNLDIFLAACARRRQRRT